MEITGIEEVAEPFIVHGKRNALFSHLVPLAMTHSQFVI
jgi:hypothetical protein